MDYSALKSEIISYSKEIGIDKIGFTSADSFQDLKNRLIRQEELKFASGFEEPDLDKRTNPRKLLPEARSIISIAVAYPSKLMSPPKSLKDNRRGIFSRSSWGTDYHIVLKQRLDKLAAFISERVPDVQLKSMVDTGELVDRAVAERAGIGWSGKNCSIITPEFGSYVYLGEMITSLPFEADQPIEDRCGTCNKCIEACPTGALIEGGQIDAKRCISFLTQTKELIPAEFRDKLGNRLYGCDSCQTACPENKGIRNEWHNELMAEPELAKPLLLPLLGLSNKQFKQQFGHVSGSWRGKNPIQRNALIALAHFKDEGSVDALIQLLTEDSRPVIRGTAAWALAKIGGDSAKQALDQASMKECDPDVLVEIEKAQETISL